MEAIQEGQRDLLTWSDPRNSRGSELTTFSISNCFPGQNQKYAKWEKMYCYTAFPFLFRSQLLLNNLLYHFGSRVDCLD